MIHVKTGITGITSMPLPLWILLIALLLSQSILLFLDARKNNAFPWLWGIWGLTQFPTPTLVYLLVVRKVWKRFIKKKGQ